MMHASSLFKLIRKSGCNFFINASQDNFNSFRKIVIDMIIATDMTKHFELLTQFKSRGMKIENLANN